MKILFVLSSLFLYLFAVEIDPKILEDIIAKDPENYTEKVILAKYYEKNGNDLKAIKIINEVLEKNPKDETALNIKKKLERKEHIKGVFKESGLGQPINMEDAQKRLDSYYDVNNYQFYITLYQALIEVDSTLEDKYHIKAAYIYLWDSRYDYSENALLRLKQQDNMDAKKIRAEACYYTGRYNCSAELYEQFYTTNSSVDSTVKLINSYIYTRQTEKAQRLYSFVSRKNPNNSEIIKIGKKLDSSRIAYMLDRKKVYEENKNIDTLEAYVIELFASGRKDEATDVVSKYNKENPSSRSLLLEAKYLIWTGKNTLALEVLKKGYLDNDLQAKLMIGQVYSWEQKFYESEMYLNEVIVNAQDKELLYEAKKARAYVHMWKKENTLAKKAFVELNNEAPLDEDVKEALMELNHDYAGLIEIYKQKIKVSSKSANDKRLAELYISNKQPKMAIEHLKKYVQDNTDDLEATKNLAQLLIENKEYSQGFGYLEHYAQQKKTAQSSFILAQYYHWNGFSKEALYVLDGLLKEHSNNEEALKLKAQILKLEPVHVAVNSEATIGAYFNNIGSKQLDIADSLYFNSHYRASLMYYEDYLEKHPTDHQARYRYAFALEYSEEYGKAEGEFALMLWTEGSDELRYHYAYNVMKNKKLKEAKKLFLELKSKVYQKADPSLRDFLMSWELSWESKNFNKYAKHYGELFTKNNAWVSMKQDNFNKLQFIAVGVHEPIYKQVGENQYMVKFYQEYNTNYLSDKGYKTLHLQCDANKSECKIINEDWKESEYSENYLLVPQIDQKLQEIDELENAPLAVNNTNTDSKKKSLCLKNITILS
ncbi:tetratricopeptide repeat protein [bacterium]|nr:tetratricopeptide repeat protein [bacterium]MBU1994666.1 tetratricopeptide repeat protein [bacterium]